jgi:hypothetical protein
MDNFPQRGEKSSVRKNDETPDSFSFHPDEAEALYALYEVYRAALKSKLAFAALSQAVHTQVDEQKKTRWEEELNALGRISEEANDSPIR